MLQLLKFVKFIQGLEYSPFDILTSKNEELKLSCGKTFENSAVKRFYVVKKMLQYFLKKSNKVFKDKFIPQQDNLDHCKKYCMLVMYCGKNYLGMQINEENETIETHILSSLYKLELINERAFKLPQLCYFNRASKTDCRVSSIGQVCVIKINPSICFSELKLCIQNNLPYDIILLVIFTVPNNFNVLHCDSRIYKYVIPTFAFEKNDLSYCERVQYRMSNYNLVKINKVLSLFKGTHNFHNYSSKFDPLSQKSKRYIIDFKSSTPFLIGDREFVTLEINGQSFILHQIRKMVAMALLLSKDYISFSFFMKCFTYQKMNLPKAPPTGLFLDRVVYNSYNKFRSKDGEANRPIIWDNYETERNEFKFAQIYINIFKSEIEERIIESWCNEILFHNFFERQISIENVNIENELFHGSFV